MYAILFTIFTLLFGITLDNGNPLPIKDKSKLKQFKKNYSKVPQGVFVLDGMRYTIPSDYYMLNTEVTNLNYKEFITDLKSNNKFNFVKNIVEIKNIKEGIISAETYFQHSAYEDYPVVNISKSAATIYCVWLREKLAQNLEIDPSKIEVRLPSKIEWIYAAKATKSENVYAWHGPYLRNADGQILANFNMSITTENITYDHGTNTYKVVANNLTDTNSLQSPAKSYLPNDLGLYNMSGNVSEFVMDDANIAMGGSYLSTGYDVRAESELVIEDSNSATGFRPIVVFK